MRISDWSSDVCSSDLRQSIEDLQNSTGNLELQHLIKEADLAGLVEKGYEVRGVFITNVNEDASAVAYLASRSDISVFDGAALNDNWVPPGEAEPLHTAMTFRLDGLASIQSKTQITTVYVALLLPGEWVAMGGIKR